MTTTQIKKEMIKGFLGTIFLNEWYTINGVQYKKIYGQISIIQSSEIGLKLGNGHANFIVKIEGKKQNIYIQGCKTDICLANNSEKEIDSDTYKVQ